MNQNNNSDQKDSSDKSAAGSQGQSDGGNAGSGNDEEKMILGVAITDTIFTDNFGDAVTNFKRLKSDDPFFANEVARITDAIIYERANSADIDQIDVELGNIQECDTEKLITLSDVFKEETKSSGDKRSFKDWYIEYQQQRRDLLMANYFIGQSVPILKFWTDKAGGLARGVGTQATSEILRDGTKAKKVAEWFENSEVGKQVFSYLTENVSSNIRDTVSGEDDLSDINDVEAIQKLVDWDNQLEIIKSIDSEIIDLKKGTVPIAEIRNRKVINKLHHDRRIKMHKIAFMRFNISYFLMAAEKMYNRSMIFLRICDAMSGRAVTGPQYSETWSKAYSTWNTASTDISTSFSAIESLSKKADSNAAEFESSQTDTQSSTSSASTCETINSMDEDNQQIIKYHDKLAETYTEIEAKFKEASDSYYSSRRDARAPVFIFHVTDKNQQWWEDNTPPEYTPHRDNFEDAEEKKKDGKSQNAAASAAVDDYDFTNYIVQHYKSAKTVLGKVGSLLKLV